MPNFSYKNQFLKNQLGWRKSFLEGFSQDEFGDSLPWMTYPFIEFITPILQPHHEIFEFGLGSSTFFFAKKVKKITSLESNKKWHEIMLAKFIEQNINNAELILMEDALNNENYENYLKNSAQKFAKKFDFIIIDSLKRDKCIRNSLSALNHGGMIILDDSERKGYKKIFNFMEQNGFNKKDFFGIAPGQFRRKNTTIFFKN